MTQIVRTIGACILAFLLGQTLLAQSWTVVGNAGFSEGYVNTTRIAVAPDGTPYVVYYDAPNQGNVTVKKYNGSTWVTVGAPGFSGGLVNNTDIAIDPSGSPHVVYYDAASGGKATVKKFNGSSWVTLGNAGFSDGFVNNTSIAISNAGIPYVVYYDAENGGKATVKRFFNNAWQNVGAPAFSDGFVNTTDIAIDPSGVPYVVYYDAPNGGKATVKKFNGSTWQTVGAQAFSDGIVNHTTIAINNTGVPYVAYYDAANGGKATVKRFSGTTWATVGSEGFSDSYATYIDIAITTSGVPYVVYIDAARGAKATVEKFNGSSWEYAGSAGFSAGIVNNTSIAVSKTGAAYVVYYDAANGGRATVQKYIAPVNTADSLALVDLYNNTGGNSWTNKTGWLTGPARTWRGVTIDDEGYVTGIDLFSNNLSGSLPASLGSLSRLTNLYLYRNNLTGSIPSQLGNLQSLGVLSLGENRLSGSIPTTLGNLSSLLLLDLRVNQLTGSIPSELRQLSNLNDLFLLGNQLTGGIPDFSGMPYLRTVALSGNRLSGSIPASLGNLSSLQGLALESNQLTGSIPAELGNLSNLTYLYLGVNNLSGSIPASLGNCTKLTALEMSNNAGLNGTIPSSLGNLNLLKILWIGNCAIEGGIPSSVGNLVNLEQLIISNTQVTGPIPNSLGNLSKLKQLSLNNNLLVGPIPAALGNLFSLTDLHLNNNQLSGPIPASLTNLNNFINFGASINISNNKFTFDGMEAFATKFPAANYAPQAPIMIYNGGCGLAVASGGTLTNSTFTWIRQAPASSMEARNVGNPFFYPTKSGKYFVQITNSIATRLTLNSEFTDVGIAFPTQPQQYVANREETDALGWTHYYYDYIDAGTGLPDYKILLSLKKNGNNIGTLTAGNLQVKVAATAGAGTGQGLLLTSPLITNQSGYYVMHRYWSVVPANQPTTPVGVRFYYNDQDFTDVKGSVPSLIDHKSLFFYKTEGGSPDPASNIAGATKLYSIANGITPKLDTFVYFGQGCGQHMAEYLVRSFSGGGGGGTVNGQAILPVKLNLFTGRLADDAAILYWETAQEQSASHFNIQRSANGVDFVNIGKVKATGNSITRKEYSFTDQAAGSLRTDKIYYRLQTEDINGKQELSKTVVLKPGTSVENIQLAANPVTDYAYLLMQAKEKSKVAILVTDMAGRTLMSQSRTIERGMNNLPVNVQSLAAGIYMLSVKNADGIQTVRFIKK
ncbi:MAG: T9SS type A sorting domain-containing protein [Niastella sp.]|nr:T9SS type A sorting domain-containing protein [Niastella sp.]